jgi:predicted transporter
MVSSHRIFTVSMPVPVCFITYIALGSPVLDS